MFYRTGVSAQQLKAMLPKQPLIIDIRDSYQFNRYHFQTATNIPYRTLLMYPERYLTPNQTYYIICSNGSKSSRACQMLTDMGYSVINVYDGYNV